MLISSSRFFFIFGKKLQKNGAVFTLDSIRLIFDRTADFEKEGICDFIMRYYSFWYFIWVNKYFYNTLRKIWKIESIKQIQGDYC